MIKPYKIKIEVMYISFCILALLINKNKLEIKQELSVGQQRSTFIVLDSKRAFIM
jgi:hypothetical protein